MSRFRIFILMMFVVSHLLSCGSDGTDSIPEEEVVVPNVSIPNNEFDYFSEGMSFDVQSEEKSLIFCVNVDWKIAIENNEGNWCSVIPMSGHEGKQIVKVKTNSNESYQNRSVKLLLSAGNVTKTVVVTQKQKDGLIVEEQELNLEAKGGNFEIKVHANVEYDIQNENEWIVRIDSRGLKEDCLLFNAEPNKVTEARKGRIVVSSKNRVLSDTIVVYQKGKDATIDDWEDGNDDWWKPDDENL